MSGLELVGAARSRACAGAAIASRRGEAEARFVTLGLMGTSKNSPFSGVVDLESV